MKRPTTTPKRPLNLVYVSHCAPGDNSGLHLMSLSAEMARRGYHCLLLFPAEIPQNLELAEGCFAQSYEHYRERPAAFPDDRAVDFVHAWTPREHVRLMTDQVVETTGARHVVHMEDNERQIVADDVKVLSNETLSSLPDDLIRRVLVDGNRTFPEQYERFVGTAAGYTCLVEPLLEFKPQDVPGLVFPAGFDPAFAEPVNALERSLLRARHGISDDETVVLFTGTVHASVLQETRSLYLGVALLNRRGRKVRLLRTGRDYADLGIPPDDPDLNLNSLGFVPRSEMPSIAAIADICVQPGVAGPFNSYRFPSKIPEYLAAGRPVIMGDVNIGQRLVDGETVLKLERGDALDVAAKLDRLIEEPSLAKSIGAAGRAFALAELGWPSSAKRLDDFYRTLSARRRGRAASTWSAKSSSYPVDLFAFYTDEAEPQPPVRAARIEAVEGDGDNTLSGEIKLAQSFGISGFCFDCSDTEGPHSAWRLLDTAVAAPGFSACLNWRIEPAQKRLTPPTSRLIGRLAPLMQRPGYIRIDGAPLLAVEGLQRLEDPIGLVQALRAAARETGLLRIHISAVQRSIKHQYRFGVDSLIERPPLADGRGLSGEGEAVVKDYIAAALGAMRTPAATGVFRGVFPRWRQAMLDGREISFINDSPLAYGQWLRALVRQGLEAQAFQVPIVFLNAWNDRSSGAALTPDGDYDAGLLQITREALHQGIVDFVNPPGDADERAFIEAVRRLPAAVR